MGIEMQLKAIRQYFECTQVELAEKTGLDLRRIQNIESGKVQKFNNMELEVFTKLGFDMIWLLTGIGDMFGDQMYSGRDDDFVKIPYYDQMRVSAGLGTEVWEEAADGIDEIPRRLLKNVKSFDNIRCIKVSGYSMTPRYDDGDYVFVDISQNKIGAEGIYIIGVDGMLLVKLVQWIPGGIRLISHNKDFEAIDLTEDTYSPDCVRVIGKVVGAFTYV